MLSRLARWYGTDVWDLAATVMGIAALAAFVAAWMLVDHGSVVRALTGAGGVALLALPPLASRHVQPGSLSVLATALAYTLSVGTTFFAISELLWQSYACALALVIGSYLQIWAYGAPFARNRKRGAV